MYGSGELSWDSSVMKMFPVWREQDLQFRFEAFNAPNHPNSGLPTASIQSSSFGQMTSTAIPMRELQVFSDGWFIAPLPGLMAVLSYDEKPGIQAPRQHRAGSTTGAGKTRHVNFRRSHIDARSVRLDALQAQTSPLASLLAHLSSLSWDRARLVLRVISSTGSPDQRLSVT